MQVYALYEVHNEHGDVWENLIQLYKSLEDANKACRSLEKSGDGQYDSWYEIPQSVI